MKILLLAILFTSCGVNKNITYIVDSQRKFEGMGIDKQFVSTVEVFEVHTNILVDFPIQFDDLEGDRVGECRMYGNKPEIAVDKEHWEGYTNNQKEWAVLHELLHCGLHKEHNNELRDDWCPVSLMNSYIGSDYCYEKHRAEYLEEL